MISFFSTLLFLFVCLYAATVIISLCAVTVTTIVILITTEGPLLILCRLWLQGIAMSFIPYFNIVYCLGIFKGLGKMIKLFWILRKIHVAAKRAERRRRRIAKANARSTGNKRRKS